MKLVEILARELKEWPEGADHAYQDPNKCVYFSSGQKPERHQVGTGWNVASNKVRMIYGGGFGDVFTKAKDHATAIVTRADWQAAKDKLEGKTVKDENPWRRNRGRKTPPIDGLVDVKYRDGTIHEGNAADWWEWQHTNDDDDIMYWRAHTPPAKPATVKQSLSVDPVSPISGPLQWRDRITEIDAESKAENDRHSAAMTALDTERAELVQKLSSEGLAMIERKAEPVEDMSDPANWREGDVLECVNREWITFENFAIGSLYTLLRNDGEEDGDQHHWLKVKDGDGDYMGVPASEFKWHSRPTN